MVARIYCFIVICFWLMYTLVSPQASFAMDDEQFVEASLILSEFETWNSHIRIIPQAVETRDHDQGVSFSQWIRYEDTYISFLYPKHPEMTLTVEDVQDAMPRTYVLRFSGKTYCSFLLEKEMNFGKIVGFFTPVIYAKYGCHNGAFYRISFLKSGRIERFQMIGNGFRLMFSNVTTDPISEDLYLKIAFGAKIKGSTCEKEVIQTYLAEPFTFKGLLGLLEKGMTREDIINLLGTPSQFTDNILNYVVHENGWEITAIIQLENSILKEFNPDWVTVRELSPES